MTEAMGVVVEKRVDENATDAFTSVYLCAAAAKLSGGATFGAAWNPLHDLLQSKLKQGEDGSWLPPRAPAIGTGAVESTALGVMAMGMPWRVLPLYGK
jgi:hypothetical protein